MKSNPTSNLDVSSPIPNVTGRVWPSREAELTDLMTALWPYRDKEGVTAEIRDCKARRDALRVA